MGYPPHPQDPYGQQPYGQSGPQQPYQQPYPPQQPGPPQVHVQVPVNVSQVTNVHHARRSVTKPAWTLGDILWLVFTAGLAWPWIWAKRRRRTTITRHR